MNTARSIRTAIILALLGTGGATPAFAQTYTIQSEHTYPGFEAPHLGISWWRGKFLKTSGKVTLDRERKTGSLSIEIDAASIDFGHQKMNEHARSPDFFDVARHPTITFKGGAMRFAGDMPAEIDGELTLLGNTRPLTLRIESFRCITHPLYKREICGADVRGGFNRRDFGMARSASDEAAGQVRLVIQVEALRDE